MIDYLPFILNDEPEFKLNRSNFVNSGSYGRYYKVSKTCGIKVVKAFYDNPTHNEIHREYQVLAELYRDCPGVFPKPYRVVTVIEDYDRRGRITHGILMEHIEGVVARNIKDSGKWTYEHEKQINKFRRRMNRKGWRWKDGHSYNMMVAEDQRIRFIDGSPDLISKSNQV